MSKKIDKGFCDKLNSLHLQITNQIKSTVQLVLEAGEMLIELKDQIPHGEFTNYIENNLSFSPRTARRYMAASDYCEKHGVKTDTVSDLKELYRLTQNAELCSHGPWKEDLKEHREILLTLGSFQKRDRGETPDGWTDSDEKEYKRWKYDSILEAGIRYYEGKRKTLPDSWSESHEREYRRRKRAQEQFWNRFFCAVDDGGEALHLDDPDKDRDQKQLFKALDEYFGKFDNDNRKLEAISNVIKKLRRKANECHVTISGTGQE